MQRKKMLRVMLSDKEYEKLKNYAAKTDRKVSETIRDYIKGLSE
jgi:hypothetical protein